MSAEVAEAAPHQTGAHHDIAPSSVAVQGLVEPDTDTNPEESDDGYGGSDTASSTASLRSSIMKYRYENGRRYHAYQEGEYVIPNDEREQDRMDVGYHIFKMILGGELYASPLPETTSRILDLGTGTGAWAIEVADRLPQSTVIGVDLSPIQPSLVPPNCEFQIFDFETEWNFSQPFDFIHARNTEGSTRNHSRLFSQAFTHLKPGGFIEAAEATVGVYCDDDTISNAPNLVEWQDHLLEASGKFGKPMGVAKNYKTWLEEVGFVDVFENIYKLPFSPWPKSPPLKQLGRYQQHLMLEALDAYSLALFTRVLGWEAEKVHVLLAGVRKELENRDRSLHLYSRVYFVTGRKPQ